MKRGLIVFILLIFSILGISQSTGSLSGWVLDKNTQKPLAGVAVSIVNTKYTTITDSAGKYNFRSIPTGQYQLQYKALGYLPITQFNTIVRAGNVDNHTIELLPSETVLKEVTVSNTRKTIRTASLETPLSVQKLSAEEIKSNPGGNFDISKVVQVLPGVTGSASTGAGFRNDIIIRGGAPNENVFYLDGVEIPVINHFSTQGSAGGPQGILNVSFMDEVKLSSSAFDAKYDNALSSVFEFKQKRGSTEKVQGNLRLSATEFASTLEGPMSKSGKTTYLVSARRSYLQFLFEAIDLPIRPNFWDYQFKITHQIDPKTTLSFLGVGAIDEFSFARPKQATPEKIYALNASPSINQWNYTVGVTLKKLVQNGYWNLAISRNHLNNINEKYEHNLDPIQGEKTFDYASNEIENKLRWDLTKSVLGFKWTTGLNVQNVGYDNSTNQLLGLVYNPITGTNTNLTYQYATNINYQKYGAFVQLGKKALNNRLGMSAGIRTDGNSYTNKGNDLLKQLSPRMSISWVATDQITINASVGKYFKIAPNTALGFKDALGNAVNKDADYTISTHYVTGIEYIPNNSTRFTAEVFYKKYNQVPISIQKGTSLSNLGADFNILGNEAIRTIGLGKSYGLELFAQKKLTDRFYGLMSYSFFRSSYTNLAGKYIASAWENIHLISMSGGYLFNKNWELGVKFRYQGGTPYTPYDMNLSRANFAVLGIGNLDYTQLNAMRNRAFHSSDLRLDKKYNYKKTTLDFYIDITNWYGAKSVAPPFYVFAANADGTFKTTDGKAIQKNGSNAIPELYDNNSVFVTPTIGFILEF